MPQPEDDVQMLDARRWSVWVARGISYLVYAYVIVVEVILLIGFVLLLLGANPDAGFTEWAYRSLDRAMKPFRGIFTPIELGTAGSNEVASVFETSVLFAMMIYGIVAVAVDGLINWLTHRLQLIDERLARHAELARYEAQRVEYEAQRAAADARRAEYEAQLAAEQVSTPPSTPARESPPSPS